jgi:hypothetical protein
MIQTHVKLGMQDQCYIKIPAPREDRRNLVLNLVLFDVDGFQLENLFVRRSIVDAKTNRTCLG